MECDKLIVVYIKGYALVGLLWNVFEKTVVKRERIM